MIKEVSGDILLSGAQAIAHGVAPNDHFSSGLALSLREQWPALYKDFRHYCQTFHPEAGGLWAWSGAGGPRIANLLTQAAAWVSRLTMRGPPAPPQTHRPPASGWKVWQ